MKKSIALLMVLVMMLSTALGVYAQPQASQISPEAQTMVALGMLLGDSEAGVTPEYLTKSMTRLTAAIMILRLKGLYSEAMDYTSDNNFRDAKDYEWKAGSNIMAYLKANPQIGFKGVGNDYFRPRDYMTEQAYYKVLLETLGYRQSTAQSAGDFEWKDVFNFARSKGLHPSGNDTFNVDNLAFATVSALKANIKGGQKLIDYLVESGKVNKQAASAYGLYVEPIRNVDIISAVALNSKVIEVALREHVSTINVSAVSVRDAAGNIIGVSNIELAPWDKDHKTALVTLTVDTNSGTLYTISSGASKANFGGKSKDSEKPKVIKVESTDFNEIRVTFSEAVKLQGAMFEFSERYGLKTRLSNYELQYEDKDKVLITTSEQKSSTLYVGVISNVFDFGGNMMDKSENNTFVGYGKSTEYLRMTAVSANDYNEICVQFNVNVDPLYLNPAYFRIEETYGLKSSIAITSVRLATEDDLGIYSAKLDAATAKRHVILTVEPLRSATLYRITADGLRTLYGREMSSSSSERSMTFVGQSKPSTPLEIDNISAISNTKVKILFKRKVDPNYALNTANYAIQEAYMARTPIPVLAAEVDGAEVILTVGSMKNALYKLSVTGIRDIYGNNIDLSNSANQLTFVGKAVSEKISSIVNIERVSETVIRVEFNQNVGSNATDVSLYYINNGIGYPEKAKVPAATVANYLSKVELSIPKTVSGKIYKLTVRNLYNSDGVSMASSDEISKNFVGEGASASKAKIEAVYAVDNQTLRIYFDRDVTDSTIKGKIWSGIRESGNLYANALKVSNNGDSTPDYDLDSTSLDNRRVEDHTAYQDPYHANVLLVRLSTDKFNYSDSTASSRTFKLVANSSIVYSDSAANVLEFPYNNSNPEKPEIVNVYSENARSLMLYFSEPVSISSTPTDFSIFSSESGGSHIYNLGNQVRVTGAYKVPNNLHVNTEYSLQWKLILDRDLLPSCTNVPGNRIVYLNISSGSQQATDLSSFVPLKPNTGRSYAAVQFAVSDTAPDNYKATVEAVHMPNRRTIDVYFSKDMDSVDVKDINNYQIVANESGTTKADSNRLVQISDYSSSDNKVTLYLSDDIQNLTYNGSTRFAKYYLAVKSAVKDVTGINHLTAETSSIAFNSGVSSGMVREFAPSTIAAPRPEIVGVSSLDSRYAIDVRFSQKVRFPSAADYNAKNFTDNAASLTASEIISAFTIKAQFDGEARERTVSVGDIAYGTLNIDHDKLTVVFKRKLAVRSAGTISTEVPSPDKIKSKQDVSAANTGSEVSEGVFGVADSLFGDTVAPQLISINMTSGGNDARYAKVGDRINLTLSASETIQTPAVTIAGNAAAISGSGSSYTASYSMQQDDIEGNIEFLIQYRDLSGYPGVAASATLDGSGVVFDKTAPVISGVENQRIYGEGGVTPAFNEGTAILNGANFSSGTNVAVDGYYTLIVTDRSGNLSQVVFVVDIPVILADVALETEGDKAFVKSGDIVDLSFSSNQRMLAPVVRISDTVVAVNQNGLSYTASYQMKESDPEGEIPFSIQYRKTADSPIMTTDKTTDSSKLIFDKTAPVISDVVSNKIYNMSGVAPIYNEGTAILNAETFTSGTKVTKEGDHRLKVMDEAGNAAEVSFAIDATKPVVNGVANDRQYYPGVAPTFNEGRATLDGAEFISGTAIMGVGKHTLVVTDGAGNSTTIRFTIQSTTLNVKSAIMYDNYKNIHTISDYMEGNKGQDGIVDTLIITFTGNIDYKANLTEWQVLLGSNYAIQAGEADRMIKVLGDKITIHFYKNDQIPNTASDNSENGLEVVYKANETNPIKNTYGSVLVDEEGMILGNDTCYIFENNNKNGSDTKVVGITDGAAPVILSFGIDDNKGFEDSSATILVTEGLYYKNREKVYQINGTNDNVFLVAIKKPDGTVVNVDFNIDENIDMKNIKGNIGQNVVDQSTSISVKAEKLLFDQAGNGMKVRWVSDL